MTDAVMGTWSYSYDDMNRLTSGTATGGQDEGLVLGWTYDRYGNRWQQNVTGTGNASAVSPQLTFTGNNNRIDGWLYDAAGNLLYDYIHHYTYDAENRVATLDGVPTYLYDAEGRRVAKLSSSGTVTASYVLGLGAEQVSEVNGSGVWMHSNVFVGGRLMATYEGPGEPKAGYHYHLTDWLSTQRMQTSTSGNPEEICYSYPFGDGLSCTGTDATEHHFTGKERDTESGLDYFGARYLSSGLGRFMTPDWAAKPTDVPYANFGDPQTLNLYAYVMNNPMTRFDADGHDFWDKVLNAVQGKGWKDTPRPPLAQPAAPGGPPMKGVNPVTGKTLFSPTPKGQPGNERPGVGGAGNFGAPRDGGRTHHGEDISGPVGTDLHAATPGTVTFSGTMSGYGNTVKIDDGSGTVTLYGHNSDNAVSVGDTVQQGQVIGTLGQTGNAAGQPDSESHVHFEVHVNGELVNPATWLNSATNP